MDVVCKVMMTKLAEKQIRKVPSHIQESIVIWATSVEELGIRRVRLLPGYHDEPLSGKLRGQRSVRLNRSYRLFYTQDIGTKCITITVLEVNHHEYK